MNNPDSLRKRSKQGSIDSPLASSTSKGERLRRIRHLANLSREEFCADGEINLTTLISWEVGRFGGLSEKGAKRVIARVASEGVFCTLDWLLYEIGAGPEVKVDYKKANLPIEELSSNQAIRTDEGSAIIEELLLFRKLHKQSIDYIVEDAAMLPHYEIGDYVAGIKRSNENMKNVIGKDCIVQMKDGSLILRRVQAGPKENSFNLISVNFQANLKDSISYDVELAFAAPVIWHRKKDPS